MIQIIGFLGCAYMLLKAFEMLGNSSLRHEHGGLKEQASIAIGIAFASSLFFAAWLIIQGSEVSSITSISESPTEEPMSQSRMDCINGAADADAVLAC